MEGEGIGMVVGQHLKVQGRKAAAGSWSRRMTASPITAGAGSSSAALFWPKASTSPATNNPMTASALAAAQLQGPE